MVEKETFAQSLGSHLSKLNIAGVVIIDSLPDQAGCEILASCSADQYTAVD